MDKEKQINEIANIIARTCRYYRNPSIAFMTTARKTASSIYKEGYRKQSEVVDVVRCCDCKHRESIDGYGNNGGYCTLHSSVCCGYCEDGERAK